MRVSDLDVEAASSLVKREHSPFHSVETQLQAEGSELHKSDATPGHENDDTGFALKVVGQELAYPVFSYDPQQTNLATGPSTFDPRTQDGSSTEQKSPRKKRRTFLDAVEIVTPPWLEHEHRRIKTERHERQEREFLNPKWKVERYKGDEDAGLGSVLQRLDNINVKPFPLQLDDDLLDFTVSRDFVSGMYGGNTMTTFPTIGEGKGAHHNYRGFMFLNMLYNPYAPQRAGFPGLFYRSRGASGLAKIHRVDVKLNPGKLSSMRILSWIFNEHVNRHRTDGLYISVRESGLDLRVRIALRKKLHRQPTLEEIKEAAGNDAGVIPEDVHRALVRGEESMNVWVMKCVAYDEGFQREMREKHLNWTPKVKTGDTASKAKSGRKQKGASKDKVGRTKKGASKDKVGNGNTREGKRKRPDTDTPDNSDVEENLPGEVLSPTTEHKIVDEKLDARSRPSRVIRAPKRFSGN
ncbi:hypothetical protein FPV67DRAFT_1710985 [Lyophyllum atratum]|nr:hypothetical protein FPV67DRAFT_1710985 [Lyophyllum atratum]